MTDSRNEKNRKATTPREVAYLALLAAAKGEGFIAATLEKWMEDTHPTPRDAGLAREISYGTCRMALTLDAMAAQYTTTGKLALKAKEKILLRTALYQHFYLERVPLYAIANESLALARKYCHPQFVKFLNAVMRKVETIEPKLQEGNSIAALSERHSYPPYFIGSLIGAYGIDDTISILKAGNAPAPTMFRLRGKDALNGLPTTAYALLEGTSEETSVLLEPEHLGDAADSTQLYIQNATPTALMRFLEEGSCRPKRILDLCASPGGKALLAHDMFPETFLQANDVTPKKMERLKQNLGKYGVDATLSCGPGEQVQSDVAFDLIILDVPCSNSGVLNKRPEARWRISKEHLEEITALQLNLLTHAKTLLSPTGEIWYLTCSILADENEGVIATACGQLDLMPRKMKTILPTAAGWDGGFACALGAKQPHVT